MKKHLLILSGVFVGGMVMAQSTPVSQTPQNRNAVLEELTGIHCGYCPDGHKRANDIAAANPGRVVLVNVHAGGYAVPGSGEPDLRTTDGTAIDGFFNPTGYPAGGVQRYPHSSDMTRIATGRGNWASQVSSVLGEPSPANVAMDATIDASTRQLTLHVEIFYTTPQAAGTTHYLNVGILQNDFEATQSNYGGWNPDAILPNGKYLHQHIFRGYINAGGTWGESIDASQSTVISKTITVTLPASINSVPLNIGKLQFFAILHEGHNAATTSKVVTAAEVTPTYTNVPAATASANSIVNTFAICDGGSITPIIKVDNGGAAITSITFSSAVNGGTATPYTWTGNISQFGSKEITLPSMVVNAGSTNSVAVTITNVNGGSGLVGATATATKTIKVGAEANGLVATVKVTCDRYGSETSWKLFNSANTAVASGGPYTDASANGAYPQPDVTVNLVADECYKAVVYDAYGDGFDSGYGNGNFEVVVNGTTVAAVTTFSNGASMEDAMHVSASASVEEVDGLIPMSIYPNPTSEVLNASITLNNGGMVNFRIVNAQGQTVLLKNVQMSAGTNVQALDVTTLAAGVYTVQISSEGQVSTKPFVKK